MSLRDEAAEQMRVAKRPCPICTILDAADAKFRAELVECLDDETLTGAALARVLHARGYPINEDGKQIRAHRRKCA